MCLGSTYTYKAVKIGDNQRGYRAGDRDRAKFHALMTLRRTDAQYTVARVRVRSLFMIS